MPDLISAEDRLRDAFGHGQDLEPVIEQLVAEGIPESIVRELAALVTGETDQEGVKV
jgi:hypothetical protein